MGQLPEGRPRSNRPRHRRAAMTPAETAAILRQFNEWRRCDEDIPQSKPREIGEAIDAAVEMIERLEALRAELKAAHAMALNGVEWKELAQKYEAEISAMKRQAPIAWARKIGLDVPSFGCVTDLKYRPSDIPESAYVPLYALPGAQPAPSVPDEIERDVLRACCGTFHGSRHRITCEKYKGKREPGDKP